MYHALIVILFFWSSSNAAKRTLCRSEMSGSHYVVNGLARHVKVCLTFPPQLSYGASRMSMSSKHLRKGAGLGGLCWMSSQPSLEGSTPLIGEMQSKIPMF
jgi:hypothetical protein